MLRKILAFLTLCLCVARKSEWQTSQSRAQLLLPIMLSEKVQGQSLKPSTLLHIFIAKIIPTGYRRCNEDCEPKQERTRSETAHVI